MQRLRAQGERVEESGMKRNGKWKRRGKSLGRRYEWFISRGRLIFRPGCGGNVLWKRRSFLSPFAISSFHPSRSLPLPAICSVWHNLTAFYRAHACLFDIIATAVLFTVRVHPADIFYGLNFIRRALRPPGVRPPSSPVSLDGFLTTAFSSDVVCRPRVILSPHSRAPRRCSEVFRYTCLDAVLTVFMYRYFLFVLIQCAFSNLYIYILV